MLQTSKNQKAMFRKILFVKPSRTKIWDKTLTDIVPLGLEYLAAHIRNHVQKVEIVDLAKDPKTIEHYLNEFKPDLVGISITYSIEHNESLEIARKAKQAGASVVVGGYHATGLAEELALHPDINFVVRGEGEETLLELVRKGSAEGVKGVSYYDGREATHNPDRPLIKDLDSIRFPARDLRKYKYKSAFFNKEYDAIMTSRGCWGKCKFCCEPMMCKGTQRYRRPEDVVREIETILSLHKTETLYIGIMDPNFGGNPKVAEEICEQLLRVRIKNKYKFNLAAPTRVDVIGKNEPLTKKMINAGINLINLGIESPNEHHLKLMGKSMTKDLQEKAVRNIKKYNGRVFGTFVVGLPYQTKEDIWECFEYAKKLQIDYIIIGVATPLPGAELYKEFKLKNILTETDWDKYNYLNLVFKHDFLTAKQTRELIIKIYINLFKDLTLGQEYKEIMSKNKKKKKMLTSFAIKIASLINITRFSANNTENGFSYQDLSYLREFINPDLRKLTAEKGLHNIFEMSAFLKILGKQKIQIALFSSNKLIVSWTIKTTRNNVEYVDATIEMDQDTDLAINIHAENIMAKKASYYIFLMFIIRVLKDNKGLKMKLKLMRLFAAIIFELCAFNIAKIKSLLPGISNTGDEQE